MSTSTGMGRGLVYPASAASHLLNPLRNLVQPPRRVVRAMNLSPSDRVLELGCGPGWFSPALARAVPRGELVVCDLQPAMVRGAITRTSGIGNVEAIIGSAEALPFRDTQFGAVLLSSVLGEVPDPVACLAEVRRVLRTGGTLTVAETRRDSDFLGQRTLRDLASAAGLKLTSVRGPRWEYLATFIPG